MKTQENLGSLAMPEIQTCPFPFLDRLLEETPVYKDPLTNMYIVTRYEDIGHISARPDIYSNKTTIVVGRHDSPVAEEVARRYAERGFPEMHTLVTNDPPEHTSYRALVEKAFTPSYVKELEPYIEKLVDELIDGMLSNGRANLLPEFAIKVPMYIIADQLGVDRGDYDRFKLWSDVTVERNNPLLDPDRELEITDHLIDMQNYLYARAVVYRGAPTDNLLSRLVHAEVDGEKLSNPALIAVAHQLLVAGNETTTTGITTAMWLLLTNPELRAAIEADPSRIPSFVEEVLRSHSPVPHMWRVATQDSEIGGVHIPKGAVLMLSYLAGNRDPAQWSCPEQFEIGRKGVRNHLAFGRGIHFCIGNQLARGEMRIAIRKLLERLPDLRLSPDHPAPQFIPHFAIHALDHLHVAF
ncbi:cytochrome P450 [Sphingobium lactosutens]|uniref:cytochrome P450 n=1 Tax=Sphingobium lactosutens TaxID=522773 RepID=UPI0015C06BE7|nr:cytochrome P450 [Sphingobium lactosutens]NWK98269.1 cytochrome P450 [Sphingobium lactosutens]